MPAVFEVSFLGSSSGFLLYWFFLLNLLLEIAVGFMKPEGVFPFALRAAISLSRLESFRYSSQSSSILSCLWSSWISLGVGYTVFSTLGTFSGITVTSTLDWMLSM
jgi:hypothetical protein